MISPAPFGHRATGAEIVHGMFNRFNGGLIMLHSGKARANREQQRQSLVQMIKAQQLRSNDLNCSYDTAADPRHVEFMQRKYQAAQQ